MPKIAISVHTQYSVISPVFCGPVLVRSQSFAGPRTGLPNTKYRVAKGHFSHHLYLSILACCFIHISLTTSRHAQPPLPCLTPISFNFTYRHFCYFPSRSLIFTVFISVASYFHSFLSRRPLGRSPLLSHASLISYFSSLPFAYHHFALFFIAAAYFYSFLSWRLFIFITAYSWRLPRRSA